VRQSRLKKISMRLGVEQIAEARLVAEQTGLPYQAVLREWISQGAADAQKKRRRS
jgi:predicted DNA binding CopG/RHH family protein